MIAIGQYNDLRILRMTTVGLFLGDDSEEEVLLPSKYCPEQYSLDDVLRVFVYRDHDEKKIATNLVPKIQLGEFALLKVVDVTKFGAFLDWGMVKHLLVPFKEQRQEMEVGRWYLVFLTIDPDTDRLYASNKIENFLQNDHLTIQEGEEVELLIMHKTDLGYSVIINNQHKGLIFENEIFKEIRIGDRLNGFIKKIRVDHKIDVSLQPLGYKKAIEPQSQILLHALRESNGFLSFTDKSDPELIYSTFGMSKKAFKKAIGNLFKQKLIELKEDGITLIEQQH